MDCLPAIVAALVLLLVAPSRSDPNPGCCEDLGWGLATYSSAVYGVGPTGATQGFADPSICANSKVNGRCSGRLDYFSAQSFCKSGGGRLCTADEMLEDETHGSGCNYDFNWIWTSTPCTVSCDAGASLVGTSRNTSTVGSGSGDDDTDNDIVSGYKVLLGFSGSAPPGQHAEARCMSPVSDNFA